MPATPFFCRIRFYFVLERYTFSYVFRVNRDNLTLTSVHSETVGFGSGQGLSVFATAGIVGLFRGLQKSENDALGQKMLFPDGH